MKNYLLIVSVFLLFLFGGIAKVNAQFIDNPDKVDIVMIPGFDNDGNMAQYYIADLSTSLEWTTEKGDSSKWYKIPVGAVSDGINQVQAYYYKNVATGNYLYVSEAAQTELAGERSGDWPIAEAQTTDINKKTDGFKWFDRTTPWSWGTYITNAAGIDLTQADGNQYNVLTGIILMKINDGGINGEEFFGVYEPKASVGGFKGGTGNAWTAVKNPVVVENGVTNPDVNHFLDNAEKVDIVKIPGFNNDGNMTQYYLADLGTETDSIGWAIESGDADKWYQIPAGGVSDSTTDVQAYYYKNVATGRYLYISDETLTQLGGDDGDWPTKKAQATSVNAYTASFKWFDRPSNWPWGVYITNASGIKLSKREGNRYNALTGIILMKINEGGINGQEFFGIYEPNATVGGFAGGLGNAWTAVKTPTVAQAGVPNPDYFPENTKAVDIIKIPGFNNDGNMTQYFLADLGTATDSIAWTIEMGDVNRWFKIPAGAVNDSTTEVQAYYYKNVATGRYLYISDEDLAQLAGDDGDWPTKRAHATTINAKTAPFKWFDRPSNWPWGIYISNAAGIRLSKREGNRYTALTGIILMKINEGGVNGQEFFGIYEPNATVGGFAGGLGNAWTAVKVPIIVSTVPNPDYVSDGTFGYSIDSLNFFATDGGEDSNAASYDSANHTITYNNGGWHRAGWNWDANGGIDVSAFNQVWIKFDASSLPKTGDGVGGATKLQFDVVYMDDSNAADYDKKSNEIRSTATEYYYNLTPGKKIKHITLKSEAEGEVVLTDAYFYFKDADPADLIISDITWIPANPVLGDSIQLSATVKNQSEFASQNVKHGVAFSIMGTVIAWSDTHMTAMAPGEEVTLTANGGPNDGNGKWKPGLAKTFTIKAEVNDQHDVFESDYTNNSFQKDIVISPKVSIATLSTDGNVYVKDRTLHLVNFPDDARVSIYNVQGQRVGEYLSSQVSKLTLQDNFYIIKIQNGGKISNYKVVIR
jgi:hypothetical protein